VNNYLNGPRCGAKYEKVYAGLAFHTGTVIDRVISGQPLPLFRAVRHQMVRFAYQLSPVALIGKTDGWQQQPDRFSATIPALSLHTVAATYEICLF
jgi:hypothetical protein